MRIFADSPSLWRTGLANERLCVAHRFNEHIGEHFSLLNSTAICPSRNAIGRRPLDAIPDNADLQRHLRDVKSLVFLTNHASKSNVAV